MDRPFVHINVAASADGKIDTRERKGARISSERDRARVDELRAQADAVMVGGHTLHDEDPALTVRSESLQQGRRARSLPAHPAKVGVASSLELKDGAKFLSAGPARILLFTTERTSAAQLAWLRSLGAEVHVMPPPQVDLSEMLHVLHAAGIRQLLVEGGATLNFALLAQGLVDELTIYVAPLIFGGEAAPGLAGGAGLSRAAAIPLKLVQSEQWQDGGVLLRYRLPSGG